MKLGYRIIIDGDALIDIKSAALWYVTKSKGISLRYKSQVKKQIKSLSKNPYLFSIKYNGNHCLKVEKFPFLIHYKILDELKLVIVVAVLHTSRSPEIWIERE